MNKQKSSLKPKTYISPHDNSVKISPLTFVQFKMKQFFFTFSQAATHCLFRDEITSLQLPTHKMHLCAPPQRSVGVICRGIQVITYKQIHLYTLIRSLTSSLSISLLLR